MGTGTRAQISVPGGGEDDITRDTTVFHCK